LIQGITSPNMGDGGHSMKTWVHAQGGYGNKSFFIPRAASSGAPGSRIAAATYELYLYVPSAYTTSYQALEFELQQQLGTTIWNMAWQYQPSSNSWRIFHFPDDADHGWHASGITQSADFAADTWYQRTGPGFRS
jgi:hypothetical protein